MWTSGETARTVKPPKRMKPSDGETAGIWTYGQIWTYGIGAEACTAATKHAASAELSPSVWCRGVILAPYFPRCGMTVEGFRPLFRQFPPLDRQACHPLSGTLSVQELPCRSCSGVFRLPH